MISNQKTHLLNRIGTWASLVALASTVLMTGSASALGAQLKTRSVTVNNSAGAATGVTYNVSFQTFGSNEGVGSVKFEICDSPLESVSCAASASAGVASNGASFAGAPASITPSGLPANAWNKGTATGASIAGTYATYADGTASQTETANPQITFPITGVTNPAGDDQQYYLRVTFYSDQAYSTETGFGGIALGTSTKLSVTANVQENLVFAVGISGASCAAIAATGSTVTLTPNPMTSGAVSTGTAKLCASTNATSGYSLAYNATGFVGPSQTITPAAVGGSSAAIGGEQFGFTLTNQTSGLLSGLGAAPVGAAPTLVAPYNTANSTIAYNAALATSLATTAGPTAETVYTVLYAANIAPLTKPGTYVATQTYIATGKF